MKPESNPTPHYVDAFQELNEKRERFVTRNFISRASAFYPMDRIYYPACGKDTILTDALPDSTVYYIDNTIKHRKDGVFFYGDYRDAPFEENSFDALFLKDIHLKESGISKDEQIERLKAILKPIKPEGLVIAAKFGCNIWEIDVPFVRNSGLVKTTNIPFTPKELEVFFNI